MLHQQHPTHNQQIASVVDAESISSIIQRRCGDLGVTVEFSPRAQTACTNGKHIIIPALRHPITKDQLDTLYGYTIHETGHHLRSDAFKILKAAQPPEHLCAIYNIVEDDGMERAQALAWNGDRIALSVMNNILLAEATGNWKEALANPKPTQHPEPIAALNLNQFSRMLWDDHSTVTAMNLIQSMPQDVVDLTDTLEQEGWVKKFRATKTPHDTWDVAVDLAKRLYPGKEEEYEKVRKAGHAMEEQPRSTKGDTFEDAQGKGQTPDPNAEGEVISWKDVVLSEHNEWEQKSGEPGNLGIDWTGMAVDRSKPALMPLNMINVVDMEKTAAQYRAWKCYLPHNEAARQFANNIRRYMQAKVKSKVYRHQRHGRLDPSSIIKLALPPIEKGEYNKKIFYQRELSNLKDTAIFVLTDWSGSMRGSKMVSAADASQRLVYVMERILRIPVALAAFSNGRTKCDVGYIKPFGTRGLSEAEVAQRFAKFIYYTSANNDADALNWAYHQLRSRPEKRKILIVLSDGCPAGQWAGSGRVNLTYLAKHIEAEGKIELYGVGIHSDAVKSYYTNYKVLNSPDEINNTLFQLIKDGDTHERRRY